MYFKRVSSVIILFLIAGAVAAQLPLTNKYSTFGVIAYDSVKKKWGVALATNNIGIGQPGVYHIKPGVGIVVSIAFTEPSFPKKGIDLLQRNYKPDQVFDSLISNDLLSGYRQLAIMDKSAKTFCYTGNAISAYSIGGCIAGRNVMVFGNSLMNDKVLPAMFIGFKDSGGELHNKLYESLVAAQNAGGQNSGKMSTAVCVKTDTDAGFNDTDIRVDYSLNPFEDLRNLINKKDGLDQLSKARKQKNNDSAIFFLNNAAMLLDGWTLSYTEVSKEYYKRNRSDLAVKLLERGIAKDPAVKNTLCWDYFLIDNVSYQQLIDGLKFSLRDWLEAVNSLIEVGDYLKAENVAKKIMRDHSSSSHLNLLLGKALEGQGKLHESQACFRKAVALDKDNLEAARKIK